MGKIKVRDIEGSNEDVVRFFNESGLDIGDYINSARKIKIPLWSIISTSALFFVTICIITILGSGYEKLRNILILFSIALAFLNLCIVYMAWKNKTIAGIIALAEIILFSISLNIYSPKEVVKKIEDKISNSK